ncbi:MAG: chromosome segregation [Lasallia pustulata]|uniref:Structural maintenance of chromosomes protein n=1 Tax=Lasallia pustulata TaxID=136370 RepID=A0A5M8PSV0_9LECA|nr:MAG: chromosome segregation [Lasallia pustulata]
MYIKQIIIQGFKSYKEQTVIEPFSPKHNVIVGRNGSGKSNFFAAIRFVLSDAYTQMGREERQALLHEGTGPAVMSAFVEIIFDNSDDRFPTGKPELILRRTIGLKKDEYSLDRKNATKADVMNLLESAGFSRSNPYYIVPQGRVTALTNMKDTERLNLLKEVAGTQVYEARRAESLKIMTETNNKRAKIDELLDYIKERLAELEEEKEELRDYQDKDKERRCLQYTLDHREQVEIASALDTIDEQRQNGVDDTDDRRERFIQGEKELTDIETEINELRQQVEFLKVDKRQLEDERRDNARARAKVELDVKGLSDGQSAAQQAKDRYEKELETVRASIQQREEELQTINPRYAGMKDQESTVKSQLDSAEAARQRLYAKQGRNARFGNKRERDDWLRKEIDDSYPQLAKVKAVRMQTDEDIVELEKTVSSTEQEISEMRHQFDDRGNSSEAMKEQVLAAKVKRDQLMDERKELWREDAKLDSVIANAQKELSRAEQVMSHTMDQNTSRGLAAVRRIKRQYNLNGVYGTLAELVEVNEKYRTAVEVTAGNSLFHYVVDNDETATKVLEVLQKERAGRVTFMPLNRLKPKLDNIPKANDSIPMIEKLQFDPIYEKGFQQVFGKTVVCPNLTTAAQYARSHGVNAITMDGDRSDKKGALTGGFHDPRQSRLEAVRNVMKWRNEYEAQRNRSDEIKRTLERKDQEVTMAVGELQKLEQKRQQQEASYGPLRYELQGKVSGLQNMKDTLDAKQRAKSNIEANIKALTEQQNAHEAEIASEFKKALTTDEEIQLENLNSTLQDLRRQYSEVASSRSELEGRKSTLEMELRENLRPRMEQLESQALDNGDDNPRGSLKDSQRELKRIGQAIDVVERKLREAEESIDHASAQIADLEQRHAETRRQQEQIAKSIEHQQQRMEKSMRQKAVLTAQAAECSRKIRDLGVLPQEAFERFEKTKSNAIIKRLHKVNEALKKYSHVNKKAFEQYNNFTTQRDTLTKRRAELDSSQASIEDLITVLDQRKDEAIERTFKQVSREFTAVFEKLVPAGRGRLVIQPKEGRQRQDDDDDDDDDNSDNEARRESVENYTGVGISVSFNSKHDDQQRIQQLSGGQKSLCALALVFAIQRCDPAPFYLFDEIDANLDAQYRTAVAQMLQSISASTNNDSGAQFICTTFRPEMLLVAQKCYGVRYEKKSSGVVVVSREEALKFVEGERA